MILIMKRLLSLAIILAAFVGCGRKAEDVRPADVIFDTDANNELDDQHAIAYLLLNGDAFNVLGITTNATRVGGPAAEHSLEARRVLGLIGKAGEGVQVIDGATGNFLDIKDSLGNDVYDGSEAVDFIIGKAEAYSPENPLTLIAVGKLTNVALALLKAPGIAGNIRLVWLGSNYPQPGEYNMENDIPAMNYVLDTDIPMEIVTVIGKEGRGTDYVRVTLDFVHENFAGLGPHVDIPVEGRHGGEFSCFGDYAIDLFEHINLKGPEKTRALYDMAAVAIVKNPKWAVPYEIPAPEYVEGKWVARDDNPRKVTVWDDFSKDGIVEDFIETLKAAE